MAPQLESAAVDEREEEQDHDGPASYHPPAPPDELFDISTTVDPSYIISLIRKLVPMDASVVHKSEAMDIGDDFDKNLGVSMGEEAWEEYGCILWDLAANRMHAELMVQNLVLEVLLANFMVAQSVRVTEISLGIIGNLACYEVPMRQIVSTNGLIEKIVEQLFLDDTQCLCEACRLLTIGLQSSECIAWTGALQSEHIMCRILFVTENTLNPQLIEKSVGLLLAILESQQEVMHALLPPLMKLGLPSLLVNLLTFEMSKLTSEKIPERRSHYNGRIKTVKICIGFNF